MPVLWIYIGTQWDTLRSEKAGVVVMPDDKVPPKAILAERPDGLEYQSQLYANLNYSEVSRIKVDFFPLKDFKYMLPQYHHYQHVH